MHKIDVKFSDKCNHHKTHVVSEIVRHMVSKNLAPENKTIIMEEALACSTEIYDEGNEYLNKIVTVDEMSVYDCDKLVHFSDGRRR